MNNEKIAHDLTLKTMDIAFANPNQFDLFISNKTENGFDFDVMKFYKYFYKLYLNQLNEEL